MIKDLLVFFGVGSFLMFVGFLQIQNVRHALKTGIISVGLTDTSRVRAFDRTTHPLFYHLNFWPCLFAAVVLPILEAGSIVLGYSF